MTVIETQARSIFLAALERAPDKWPAFLDKACGSDADVRARVDQLLQAHQLMGSIHRGDPELLGDCPRIRGVSRISLCSLRFKVFGDLEAGVGAHGPLTPHARCW